ncbi:signal peptidase I [Desulforhopalus vacuolatus]|uniref:signal peptidase I n=1 Tax=Desulforhopalus vacuolatus TaxID=40414 RepID=UPI0030840DFC
MAKSEKKRKSVIREYVEAITIAVLLALFIRYFVVQAFKIPSGSMKPTLLVGDYLMANKFIYGIKNPFTGKVVIPISSPKRGDIVVFPNPREPQIDFIKRIIGVAGDIIEIRDKKLYRNNQLAKDSHACFTAPDEIIPNWGVGASPRDNLAPIVVPEGKVFVMGDNRDNSYDSRFWGFVDVDTIQGKAFILYWSWEMNPDQFWLAPARFETIRWGRIGEIIH